MSDTADRRPAEELLARILGPGGPELSCEECFAQLDRYVELTLADGGSGRARARHAGAPRRLSGVRGGLSQPARLPRRESR